MVRVIDRIVTTSEFPELPTGKIAVFVGAHAEMSKAQTEVLDRFCASNNAVVFCDHTSSYKGKYRALYSLVACQQMSDLAASRAELLIHIGEITGDYYSPNIVGKQVWRVSEDGEIRDTFRKLRYVFEMPEQSFFEHYSKNKNDHTDNYLEICKNHLNELNNKIPQLPFSKIGRAHV